MDSGPPPSHIMIQSDPHHIVPVHNTLAPPWHFTGIIAGNGDPPPKSRVSDLPLGADATEYQIQNPMDAACLIPYKYHAGIVLPSCQSAHCRGHAIPAKGFRSHNFTRNCQSRRHPGIRIHYGVQFPVLSRFAHPATACHHSGTVEIVP